MTDSLYKKASIFLGIDEDKVREAYLSYWRFIKEHIVELPIHQDMTEEEYKNLKHVFSVPRFGKFYIKNYGKVKYYGKKKGYAKAKRSGVAPEPCSDNSR